MSKSNQKTPQTEYPVSLPLKTAGANLVRMNLDCGVEWAFDLVIGVVKQHRSLRRSAEELGISYRTFHRWLIKHPKLNKAIESFRLTPEECGALGAQAIADKEAE